MTYIVFIYVKMLNRKSIQAMYAIQIEKVSGIKASILPNQAPYLTI